MDYVDDKLDSFARTVMKEAMDKRAQILERAIEGKKAIFEQSEIEALKKAYEAIQKEVRKVQKEKNEMISKAIIEGKKAFLSQREKIVDQVFSEVITKIKEFVVSNDYKGFLLGKAQEGISTVGDGEIIVIISSKDIQYKNDIVNEAKKKFSIDVKIEEDTVDNIGGCKVWNKTKSIIADFTINTSLQKEREEFLKISGLALD